MVSLFYHIESEYSDYDTKYFVYVINQFARVMDKVCEVGFGDARSIYHSIARKDAKFARKSLKAPKELFRTARGGYALHNSLFLLCHGEVQYYWRGNLEEVLEEILRGGREYLATLC